MTLPTDILDSREAGRILKAARTALKLTQGQVIEAVGIPNQSYLSALENGRYNVANSEYFPALAQLLRLTVEQVREINPSAVITVAAPAPTQRQPTPNPARRELPPALLEAVQKYGGAAPDLRQDDWQQYLASFRPRGDEKDADDWYDFYRNLVKFNVKPGDPN